LLQVFYLPNWSLVGSQGVIFHYRIFIPPINEISRLY